MYPRTACCHILMVGVFVMGGISSGRAQTAEDILNKAAAIYSSATTYQSTYHWEEQDIPEGKPPGLPEVYTMQVKVKDASKYSLHAVDLTHDSSKNDSYYIYDNGSRYCLYLVRTKTYSDELQRDLKIWDERFIPELKSGNGFTYTLLPSTTVNGKAAYVIEAKGDIEHREGHSYRMEEVNGRRVEIVTPSKMITLHKDDLFYIDRANFHLLQRKLTTVWPDRTVKITQIIKNELLNAPIPDSAFVFTIPKGATKE